MGSRRAGDAMDDVIRFIVKPMAVIDDFIGDVGARDQGEGGNDGACWVRHYIAAVLFDIVDELLVVRIAVGPLEGVAVASHDLTSLVAKVEDDRLVIEGGFADGVIHVHSFR